MDGFAQRPLCHLSNILYLTPITGTHFQLEGNGAEVRLSTGWHFGEDAWPRVWASAALPGVWQNLLWLQFNYQWK